jgi:4-aminobutyrate aminotransferase-like enzyme
LTCLSQQVLNNIAEQQSFLAAELQRLTAFKTADRQQLDSSGASAVSAAAGASHDVQGQDQLDQQQQMLQGNYCCRLMAAATEEQWQQAAQMTPHVSCRPKPHPMLCCRYKAAADAYSACCTTLVEVERLTLIVLTYC